MDIYCWTMTRAMWIKFTLFQSMLVLAECAFECFIIVIIIILIGLMQLFIKQQWAISVMFLSLPAEISRHYFHKVTCE